MTILESFRTVSSNATRAVVGALALAAFLPAASARADIPKGANLPFALKDIQKRSSYDCDTPYVVVTRNVIPDGSQQPLHVLIEKRYEKAGIKPKFEFAEDPVKSVIYLCGKLWGKDVPSGASGLAGQIDETAASINLARQAAPVRQP